MSKTILVTGAAGFIGFHLTLKLIQNGWTVVGYDNINSYYDPKLKLARLKVLGVDAESIKENQWAISANEFFKFIKGSLEDMELLQSVYDEYKFDAVCNLAAQAGVRYSIENPQAYISSNIVGFTNILELSQKYNISHLVYASSSSVYGLNMETPFSTHHGTNHPVSLYAATKKSNELMAHVYSKLYNLPTTGLRFFTVYGPWGRPDMSPMLFADSIVNDKPIKVFNYGNMGRDFTYIADIVEGVYRVILKPANANKSWDSKSPDPSSSSVPYRIYNIGSSSPVRLLDYIETMEKAFGKVSNKELLPMQAGDVLETFCDVSDLEKDFGYKPTTELSEGLNAFAVWYHNIFLKL